MTYYHRNGVCYFRSKAYSEFAGTAEQLEQKDCIKWRSRRGRVCRQRSRTGGGVMLRVWCKRFRKVNPDGTDAPVKVKLLKNVRVRNVSITMVSDED